MTSSDTIAATLDALTETRSPEQAPASAPGLSLTSTPAKRPRGFAAMSPERQRAIASKGGKTAHQKGTAHEFNSAEARNAGHKGGVAVSRDREHMARIGRDGGLRAQVRRVRKATSDSDRT